MALVHAMLSTLNFSNLSELCHAPIATMSILAFLSYAWLCKQEGLWLGNSLVLLFL